MKRQIATVSKRIYAPAETIYKILADYRAKHPRILPKPYFLSLDVEEGGVGEGTIVNFKMRLLGRTQSFRSLITEPVPGRALLEMDLNAGISTRFDLAPLESGQQTQVTISTQLRNQGIVEGWDREIVTAENLSPGIGASCRPYKSTGRPYSIRRFGSGSLIAQSRRTPWNT
jgi:hypothetical protein